MLFFINVDSIQMLFDFIVDFYCSESLLLYWHHKTIFPCSILLVLITRIVKSHHRNVDFVDYNCIIYYDWKWLKISTVISVNTP